MGAAPHIAGRATHTRTSPERRRALSLILLNGVLWTIGNGLTTGPLVVYLASDLGAQGREIGLILAAPALVGVLRLLTPPIISLLGTPKRTVLALSIVSYLLIWVLPAVAIAGLVPRSSALALLIGLICVHQLLESVALAALWGWMADLVPSRIRGRFFARRQIWQLSALIPVLLLSGYFSDTWKQRQVQSAPERMLLGYAIPNSLGALALMSSLVPLAMLPGKARTTRALPTSTAPRAAAEKFPARSSSRMLAPWRDRRFWPLLLFGCWLSFSNGLTQAPQNLFPKNVLLLGVFALAVMRTTMQLGQIGYSAWVGPFSDRYGNRPALIVSQLLLGLAPIFFLLATPKHPWVVGGAWILWSAYAGLNICLPNLSLKLAGRNDASSYIATYFGVTSVFYAASTIGGGMLFDQFKTATLDPMLAAWGGRYAIFFAVALLLRIVAIVWLLAIPEPGAWRWWQILGGKPKDAATAAQRPAV